MATTLYVNGKPNIPEYVKEIVKNVSCYGPYMYKLRGVNKNRPDYGLSTDIGKLQAWAERHDAEFVLVKYNRETKNYFALFEMSDPVAQALEKEKLI